MSKRKLEIEFSNATYRVLSIKGSTKYLPGDLLSKKQIETLCSTRSWSVVIKSENTNQRKAI